ncbi:type VII secretion protein EccB [Litorihabitans aurantiacus]|uniref:Type VII secretion protein EccB n=1 Tax=Litorihabitans aurantiacus TaxID=1930061 RepID=A0AA37XFK6_9MICO|nr:type VII secretion protein EccB [Litorihabitans aurantiacus]GMA32355.1 type VII secretion protein EccB [Litorihabitans aurantiacus]
MASKKELVEAQSFSRRRLLTAFVSGAPGGRELEPTSPVRGVVAGVVIAVLVVVGGLVSGLLGRGLPDGWENGSIMVVRDNAARYVTDDGRLVPVINMASARLLVPADAPIHTVGANLVADVEVLPPAGIVGAPDNLPEPGRLVEDGWTACLAQDGGTRTRIAAPVAADGAPAATPDAAVPDAAPPVAGLVIVGGELHLVQGMRSYLVAESPQSAGIVRELGFTPESPRPALQEWLALLTPGTALQPFVPEGLGTTPAGALGQVPEVSVGTVVQRQGTGQEYVALADGRLARLDPFTAAIYRTGAGGGVEVSVSANDLAGVEEVPADQSPFPADWPTQIAPVVGSDEATCAQLDVAGFGSQVVAGDVAPTAGVDVDAGGGALALFAAEADTTSGPVRFVDENGFAYAIESAGANTREEAVARLFPATGDAAAAPVTVPYAWGDLFVSGPTLSIDAAERSRTEVPAPAEAAAGEGS